jgi:hypothetical protein
VVHGGERLNSLERSPLKKIIVHLSTQLRDIKKAGQTEKAEAFIEVLKFIHGLKNSH